MKMTDKERKNLNFVAAVLFNVFKTRGYAKADCGHYIFPETFGIVETQEGKFMVMCDECLEE